MKSQVILTASCIGLFCLLLASCGKLSKVPHGQKPDPLINCKFAVSPDGTQIAYPVPAYDEYGDPATALWIANLDGSAKKQVGSLPGEWDIAWGGRDELAASQLWGNAVYLIPLSGGKGKKFALSEFSGYASISPDGKQAAFTGYQQTGTESGSGIFLLDLLTGKVKRLAQAIVKSHASWSPDSKKLAYGLGGYQKSYKIQILDVDTSAASETGLDGVGIAWSPDGRWLAYTGKIVRGGSWWQGIAIDGSIIIKNFATDESRILTEPAINTYDEKTKRWEISGAYNPLWSPDGKRIAYIKVHNISEGDKDKLSLNEIWVMNSDGSGKKKVFDKKMPFAWAPDSSAILVKSGNGIASIPVDGGRARSVVAWKSPEPPKTGAVAEQTLEAPGAKVVSVGIPPAYAKAILTLTAEARRVYADQFKCNMPDAFVVRITKDPDGQTSLWTDGESEINLTVTSIATLAPSMQSGVFNIYGICHELGHMAMYRNVNSLGLPEGVPEGWAHYTGSVVVDEVYKKLGATLWPEPYDYASVEGLARLEKQSQNPEKFKDPVSRAAVAFYAVHQRYGAAKVMEAMNAAMESRPQGKDLMTRFMDALVKGTGDESARKLIPEDMLTSKVKWEVAQREITDQAVAGLVREQDAAGVLLRYDGGTSTDMRSTTGAGHAVVFKTPPGRWAVDYVTMYGSRYGTSTPPKENFQIFICDQDFGVIRAIDRPYHLLKRGKPEWYRVDFDPVPVPEGFYVCIYFSPTATRGFYMHRSKSLKQSHSKSALPWTFVADIEADPPLDWMIRAHLVPVKD
ncbi:MAG: hypothetical protein NT011_05130 [Kiritimatiellaeota bacterium]|nr:hypothetical protein [Kiritimatiellota bacterium]